MNTQEMHTGTRDPLTGQPPGTLIETKEFLRTSEFWMTVATMFGIMLGGLALESLDAPRVSILLTILAAAYTVGRGIAKAGSAHPFWGRDMSLRTPDFDRDRDDDRYARDARDVRDSDLTAEALNRLEARLDRIERTSTGRMTL